MTLGTRRTAAAALALGAFALGTLANAPADPQRARPTGRRPAPAAAAPVGPASPRARAGAAPQAEIDDAMFAVEPFFDVEARVPRPYAEARERVAALAARYPTDPRPALKAAWLDERLGRFDAAAAGMERYATLSGRAPNALRRLAAFYRGRARAADEARVLDELALALPAGERAPVYKRAIAAINDARPQGLSAEPYYLKILEADAGDPDTLRAYVALLLASKDTARAVAAVDAVESAPGYKSLAVRRELLAARARIYDAATLRERALAVYERQLDPRWPRAIAADYFGLLNKYGLYRERRRRLQDEAAKAGAPFATVARLFNVYAYEGNLPAAARLLSAFEAARGRGAWPDAELELAGDLYAQVGDYDQATRYFYTLYLGGALEPASPRRADVLARLFEALVDAGEGPTRIAPGGITLYRDVARLDPRPGALNGLLSLLLAGNKPALEYEAESARAAGYANRALAHSIYASYVKEFPQSPRLGEMALSMMRAFSELGMDREAVAVGRQLMAARPDSPDVDAVALETADALVRLKDRPGERAVLAAALERAAARERGVLLRRSPTRLLFRAPADPVEDDVHGGAVDTGDPLFLAPNGVLVPEGEAGPFRDEPNEAETAVYEPAGDSAEDTEYAEDPPDDYRGRPENERARPTYARLLERVVASYEADEKKTEALAFFWGEVNKHPRDEGLQERFLRWLGSADLVDQQLRAYRVALDRYDDGTWLHRLARWYVRNKRGAEVRRLTDEVIRTLDDEQVAAYVQQFAGYGSTAAGDQLDWDNRIALQVTKLALARFPNSAQIARMLLDRYAADKNWSEWERLAKTQFFASPEVRAALLGRLSETGALAASWETAKAKSAEGLAYAAFAADAARWLSRFDEAVPAYTRLVELYPGERAYAEPLADLLRSLGARDPERYLGAAAVLDGLASVYPTDHRYPTRAGEALAEYGNMGEAGKRWRRIIANAPGDPAGQLEVATLFWDYYQFDDAARTLEALRAATKDRTLYAYRLAAVYDSKHDLDRALPEYVRALAVPGGDRDGAADRLAELARDPGKLARIKSAYEAERSAAPGAWELALGFADLMKAIDATGEAVGVLNREVSAREDAAFLEEARNRFRAWRSTESEARTLRRMADAAPDERARIRALLQLAELHEREHQTAEAVAVFDRLVADHPTNVGVVEEAARYYWRAGEVAKATALYRATIGRAQGDYRKQFVRELARKQQEAGKLGEAEATLRGFYVEVPLDLDVFAQLAAVLGAAGNQEALAGLYRDALGRARAELGGGDDDGAREEAVSRLRLGMVGPLTALGRFQEAVDQHIEVVNRDPENESVLDAAFDYAARHDLTPRLVAYYEKLASDSYKDYRWGLVLGRIYDRTGNYGGAAEAYARAVVNEPQRVDIRASLASALVRAGRDEDAVRELRRAWEIDGRDPDWLVRVARIRARQGRLDEAAKAVDDAVAARPAMRASKMFSLAKALGEWGLLDQSAAMYDRGVAAAQADPNAAGLGEAELGEWAAAAARVRPVVAVFADLERAREAFDRIEGGGDPEKQASAAELARALGSVEENAFARAVVDFADQGERAALAAELIRRAPSPWNGPASERPALLERQDRVLDLARAAGLADVEEALLRRAVEATASDCSPEGRDLARRSVAELVAFYHRDAQFARAAAALASAKAAAGACHFVTFDRLMAESYRLAGDTPGETAALERLYAAAGGAPADEAHANDAAVRRLFELLADSGRHDRLVALAGTSSPFQLTLVNFLVERGDEALARRAAANTGYSPAWVNARTGQMGLYFRDAAPAIGAAFEASLGVATIGELVSAKFDPRTRLVGADYFVTARNYGMWLDAVAGRKADAGSYIVGLAEGRPRDGGAHAQLARYYLAREDVASAAKESALATALDKDDREVVSARGAVLFAQGKRAEALAAWSELLRGDDVGPDEYRAYFRELSGRGLAADALDALRPVIAAHAASGDFADVEDLVADIAEFGRAHPEAGGAIADALYGAAVDAPDDFQIASVVLAGDALPDARKGQFFRLITDRLEGQASAQLADPNGSSGYWRGETWVDPAALLVTWRKANADFLIVRGAHAEALALLNSIEAEQLGARGTLRDADDPAHDYSWVYLARATAELGLGRTAPAEAEARKYCAADGQAMGDHLPDRERCVRAALVLRAGGAAAEADGLLESTYRALVEAGRDDDASVAGLAEVLYRRDRGDEADTILRGMAARRPDAPETLVTAAEAAARGGRYPLALQLREAAARLARADALNRLELARLRAAAGDPARGAAEAADVALDARAPNRVRAMAVDVAGELAADPAARAAAAARSAAAGDDLGRVLRARLAVAGGDFDGARAALGPASAASPAAAIELGRLEMAARRPAEAVAAFERALALDPGGGLAAAVAFAGATPAEALVTLYADVGRPAAALELAASRSSAFAKRDEDEAAAAGRLSFEPDAAEPPSSRGLETLAWRSDANLRMMRLADLAALADAAAKTGRWDAALGFARARAWAAKGQDADQARRRVEELEAARRDAGRREAGTLRLGESVTDEAVMIGDLRLD